MRFLLPLVLFAASFVAVPAFAGGFDSFAVSQCGGSYPHFVQRQVIVQRVPVVRQRVFVNRSFVRSRAFVRRGFFGRRRVFVDRGFGVGNTQVGLFNFSF